MVMMAVRTVRPGRSILCRGLRVQSGEIARGGGILEIVRQGGEHLRLGGVGRLRRGVVELRGRVCQYLLELGRVRTLQLRQLLEKLGRL
jgi:hypothetical protein